MNEQPIKDNPSYKKLRDDVKNFTALKKAWPLLRPLLKMIGAKVEKVDDAMKQFDELVAQTNELTSIPDDFNDLFAARGWIMCDRMNIDLVKQAIQLGKSGNLDEAEKILIEHYSVEKVEAELITMNAVEAFRSRMSLAEKAFADFKEGRYYSTVLVVLSLLDGMVNEIQQRGFFSQDVDLTAWDSVAAHSKGLQRLTSILSQSRKKTRTEPLTVPYRHGIIHGMDLGYDNKSVAIKSWVALFATRDWALRAERDQLEAPPPKPEKSLREILQQIEDLERDKKILVNWKPRNIGVGTDVPLSGTSTVYEDNSPERKFVEFLNFWKANNYGFMAKCISTQIGHPIKELPLRIREEYHGKQLKSWEFQEIKDESPAITIITVKVSYEENGLTKIKLLEARVMCEDDHGYGVVRGKPNSRWALVTWYLRDIRN